jgi:hypothetical protein
VAEEYGGSIFYFLKFSGRAPMIFVVSPSKVRKMTKNLFDPVTASLKFYADLKHLNNLSDKMHLKKVVPKIHSELDFFLKMAFFE